MIPSSGERSRKLPQSTLVRLSLFVTVAPSLLCNIMGLLDKLWDDTVAGPRPENGLGKLRKHHYPSSLHPPLEIPVTRSIAIAERPQLHNIDTESLSSSPAGSSAPDSPFSPTTPREGFSKIWAKSASGRAEPKSPSVYDWIVISALDC